MTGLAGEVTQLLHDVERSLTRGGGVKEGVCRVVSCGCSG